MTRSERRRLVVFTATTAFESTEWWPIVARVDRAECVLIVQQVAVPGLRAVLRRLRRNIRKHGILFVPFRVAMAVLGIARRLASRHGSKAITNPLIATPTAPHETIMSTDIHSPEVVQAVRAWSPDIGVSIGAPILRASLFAVPPMGTLNLHLGRVPDYRGAPPAFWELHDGASEIGATVHWVDAGLDTGAIIVEDRAPIHPEDRLRDVSARVHELGRHVLESAMSRIWAGDGTARPQPGGGTTHRMPTIGVRARLAMRLALRRWRRAASQAAPVLKGVASLVALYVVRPVRDIARTLLGTHPVRIFTYHRVTELCRDGMTVSPRVFANQIDFVRRTHTVVSIEQALGLVESRARLRRPVAVVTFDDAYRSVWDFAAPVLFGRRLPACVFVSTSFIGNDRRFEHDATQPMRRYFDCMTWEHLRLLRSGGWSVGAHTVGHVRLSDCSGDLLRREVREPSERLEARVGATPVVFAYPFGQRSDMSEAARDEMRTAGYRACCANYGGENHPGRADPMDLMRIDLGAHHTTLAWKCLAHGFSLSRYRELLRGAEA